MATGRDRLFTLTQPYLLKNGWVMRELPESDRKYIDDNSVIKNGRRSEILFRAGHFPTTIYWLLDGKVKIYQENASGQRSTHYIYTDGDLIAYRQFVAQEIHPVSAMLMEDSMLRAIPVAVFKQLISTSSVFSRNMMTVLAQDFTIWMNRMTAFSTLAVRERVILSLLILSHQYTADRKLPLIITITRTDLAEYVGATLETVVRILNKLKSEKLVSVEGRHIEIIQPGELVKRLDI